MQTYTSREIAGKLRIHIETFRRRYSHLVLIDNMPRSVSSKGGRRFEKTSMDAWLTRFHPQAVQPLQRPANDVLAASVPDDIPAQQALLQAAYGR